MTAIEDRERMLMIDLSDAQNSADAVGRFEQALPQLAAALQNGNRRLIEVNAGGLMLSSGVLNKMHSLLKQHGLGIKTLYSSVPQTQQSALDEGWLVRRAPSPAGFDSDQFMAEAFGDISQRLSEMTAVSTPAPERISRLSVALDDGSREELKNLVNPDMETVYFKQNLRSGQVLESAGNIVLIGDAHSGSEILADGDIVIWGFLGGIAHAGKNGYEQAEIRALKIEAVQLRIAGYIARRPDRLFRLDGERTTRGPEVAKVKGGEIQIFEDIIGR